MRPLRQGNAAASAFHEQQEQFKPAAPIDGMETDAELAARTSIPDGAYLALAAGERLELCDGLKLAESSRQAIFVGCGEMVVLDHVHHYRTWRFQLPGQLSLSARPEVRSIVVLIIRQKPIGWRSLGSAFLCFLDEADSLLLRLDNSMNYGHNSLGTWEFNYAELETLCRSVGLAFRIEHFDSPPEFIEKHPEWTSPEFEFETEHLPTERVREWGEAFALGVPMAICGLSIAGTSLILIGPIGWVTKALGVLGVVVYFSLTLWGHSKWRMNWSMRRRAEQQTVR